MSGQMDGAADTGLDLWDTWTHEISQRVPGRAVTGLDGILRASMIPEVGELRGT